MRQNAPLSLRTAGAAIAAVLAFPSTAVLAQDAASPAVAAPAAPAPVIVLPQPAPLPPAPAPVLVVPAEPQAPASVEAPAETAAAPAPRARVTTRSAPAPARPAANGATPLAPAPVIADPATNASPVAEVPADIEFAPPQSVDTVESTAPVAVSDGDGLSAGELGLIGGALAIGGIAAAALLSRRRRHDPQLEPIDMLAVSTAAPPRPVVPASPAVTTAPGAIPIGSRRQAQSGNRPVGRHEAMVDGGPTADNPFLTRKNRLRRARFLDKQEAALSAQPEQGDWMDDYRRRYRSAAAR